MNAEPGVDTTAQPRRRSAQSAVRSSRADADRRHANGTARADPARIAPCRVWRARLDGDAAAATAQAARFAFDAVLADAGLSNRFGAVDRPAIEAFAQRCREQRLAALLDVRLDRLAASLPVVASEPAWFRGTCDPASGPVDPRQPPAPDGVLARFDFAAARSGLADWYARELASLLDAGVGGFAVHWPQRLPAAFAQALFAALRRRYAHVALIAWTPGAAAAERRAIAACGYDAAVCSLPWWDFRAPWFADEVADLARIGRVLAPVGPSAGGTGEDAARALRRALDWAAACADGIVFDGAAGGADVGIGCDAGGAHRSAGARGNASAWHPVSAPWARVGAWLAEGAGALVLINSDTDHHAPVDRDALAEHAGIAGLASALPDALAPAEVRRIALAPDAPLRAPLLDDALERALASPRVAIENVTPAVDGGRFAAKATVGETIAVGADVFVDGHPMLAVHLLWREAGAAQWQRTRMRTLGNDRWQAEFRAARVGRYEFTVEAGVDEFASFRTDLAKKFAAGQASALDAAEGRLLIDKAARDAPESQRQRLRALARDVAADARPVERLLAPDASELVDAALAPAFASRAPTYAVEVERRAARFAAWYELFPRSQGADGAHGTLRDVIAQLPRIAAMGFDVLYFPPIHPIGVSHRKGANNALTAGPDEPGSTYAIGSAEGGHDAVHPQLGTLEDFRALVAAAAEHGLEIALDFAVQCSPDHPWIRAHPEWFDWRPDGSLRHAENPPKKYEDIVNVDFYNAKDATGLWRALLAIVTFWVDQGVRIFRVDNPHTKPLPFWEWLIAAVRARDPDVLFLSEAFTRPKPMYRLAKLGFSQSYTYFTWRNTRAELETYLRELNAEPVRWFFRPHFFVNTPDINPYFLQTSGRAGFLIRAVLAATLSGLWGLYSGFELCESAPLPGREEYLDSEKYQLRARDWNAHGNIVAEIAALNRIRRANPALQTHLGVTFHACSNDAVLYFAKATATRDNVVLVAICLDPARAHDATVELPLWEFGLPDDGALLAEDLLHGDAFAWRGKLQQVHLSPSAPYRLWRLRREEAIA